jgi:hypothetical protein
VKVQIKIYADSYRTGASHFSVYKAGTNGRGWIKTVAFLTFRVYEPALVLIFRATRPSI